MFGKGVSLVSALVVPFFKQIQHHQQCTLYLLHCVKTATLQLELHLGEEEEVAGSEIRRDICVVAAKKVLSTCCEFAVSGHVVMEHPILTWSCIPFSGT